MGDVIANSLTVKDADFNLAMGDCHIDHLTAPKFDAELAMGDCTIGMLSGAQDVSISVITGDTDLTLEAAHRTISSSPMSLRTPRSMMARQIPLVKFPSILSPAISPSPIPIDP